MIRFQRDLQDILNGDDTCLRERQEEIEKLESELRGHCSQFRRTCIKQELSRLKHEYKVLEDYFEGV